MAIKSGSKLILLAEDDELQRFLFKKAVGHLPVSVNLITVENGAEALDFLNNPLNPKPDLIFLDVNMPFKNGLECLRDIRENEYFEDTPVVIYTTSEDSSDRETAANHRADLYLIKDGDMRSLIRILLLLLTNNPKQLVKENFLMNQLIRG